MIGLLFALMIIGLVLMIGTISLALLQLLKELRVIKRALTTLVGTSEDFEDQYAYGDKNHQKADPQ